MARDTKGLTVADIPLVNQLMADFKTIVKHVISYDNDKALSSSREMIEKYEFLKYYNEVKNG